MRVAVRDPVGAAAVLAGVGLVLAEGLFKAGDTGQIFGIERHVVDPAGAAVRGVAAVHAGHRERDKEGRGGVGDHFGDLGFHEEVQTERQTADGAVAVGVGLSHARAAVGGDIVFQRVLHGGGVGVQRGFKTVDQHVGLVVVHGHAVHLRVGRRIAVRGADADGCQKSVVLGVRRDAVEDFDVLRAVLALGIGADVRDLEVGELHALQRVTVGAAVGVQRGHAVGAAEDGFNAVHIAHTGRDVRGIPNAVLFGVGQVIFPEVDAAGAGGVDGGLVHRSGKGRDREAAGHNKDKQQSKNSFHDDFSFFKLIVEMMIGAAKSSIAWGR